MKICITILALAAIAGTALIGQAQQGMKAQQTASMKMHKAMMAPMQMKMKMTGDVDRDFAMMMAEHHRSAVEMAKIELKYGKSPVLKKMAQNIIRSQTAEIKVLEGFAKMRR